MKKALMFLCALALALGVSTSVNAELVDCEDGTVWDSDQNIRWLKDANYAGTAMTWADAVAWATNLSYGGYDNWRLPTTVDGICDWGYDGSYLCGYNVTSSEMGYMYYENLGNLGMYAIDGTYRPPGWGLANTDPFTNLQPDYYWSGTEFGEDNSLAWVLSFQHGKQGVFVKTYYRPLAWAVRPDTQGCSNSESIPVSLDIKPGSCPNPLNVTSRGVLPVAILGTEDFDVATIDPASIRLVGVAPLRSNVEDVGTPFEPFVGKEDIYDCNIEGPDGYMDLTLKFITQEIVAALGSVDDGDVVIFQLTGELYDGTLIEGEDVVVILKKGKK